MIEYLVIFGKGGAILWTFGQLLNVHGSPVNTLVRQCLLEDRSGDNNFVYRPASGTAYTLKWVLDNALDLVFVAAYQHMLTIPYVDGLLQALRKEFAAVYKPHVYDYKHFDSAYKRLLQRIEKQAMTSKLRVQGTGMGANRTKVRESSVAKDAESIEGSADADDPGESKLPTDSTTPSTSSPAITNVSLKQANGASESADHGAFDKRALQKKLGHKAGGRHASGPKAGGKKVAAATTKGKKPRNWTGAASDDEALDYSQPASAQATSAAMDPTQRSAQQSQMDVVEDIVYDDEDESDFEAEASNGADAAGGRKSVMSGLLSSLKTNVIGKQQLTAEDVSAAVTLMQKRLQERNVSAEVAAQVCSSVAATLEGKKLASFTGVSALVRTAMEGAITRILSPKRSIDVLAAIRASQARGMPYSIVFVGVNGVGKSTNLAKIAYWLRQQGLRVMIAACDTFRSGAVEQLKTHCNRLGVPLFDRGYDKDPTNVAAEAMKQAKRDGIDVVLVDTAGRMQDNEPLMQALSMLINKNRPQLVLFVGEALVGNDGVNQLVKFNQRLADLSPLGATPRLIDGIVVTKFDAIDNKVGAVLSMAYSSGAPIMFVGCGQTYVDLKRLDVRAVVKSLLE